MADVFDQNWIDRHSVLCFNSQLAFHVWSKSINLSFFGQNQCMVDSTGYHLAPMLKGVNLDGHILNTSRGNTQLAGLVVATTVNHAVLVKESRMLWAGWYLIDEYLLLGCVCILLENDFLRSVLVFVSVNNAKSSIAALSPTKGFSSVGCHNWVVLTACNPSNVETC